MAERGNAPIILGPGDGETMPNPLGGPVTFKAMGEETGGGLFVSETIPAPGEGPPFHLHRDQDEFIYVLEGELRFKLDDDPSPAPAGSFVFIPRGVGHTWQNVGSEPARLLVVFSPALQFHRFFAEFSELGPDDDRGEAFRRLGEEVGMEVLGPPLAVSDPT